LVCYEYLRAIKDEFDSGLRLLSVVELLGEQCNFRGSDFAVKFEYRFLVSLLESLNHRQIAQLGNEFSQFSHLAEKTRGTSDLSITGIFSDSGYLNVIEPYGAESNKALYKLVQATLH